MQTLRGPVVCPAFRAQQECAYSLPRSGPLLAVRFRRSNFWGSKGMKTNKSLVGSFSRQLTVKKNKTVRCSFSSSSNGNGSTTGNFNVNNEDYVNSSVVDAVEVKSGADGFVVKTRDGRFLRCVHNNPQGGLSQDYTSNPAMVLKMEDGTDLLLPIVVLEMPSVLLRAAMCNVQIARPTIYEIVKEMIEKMGYEAKLVRIIKRVDEAYIAHLYLVKTGSETECVCFDLRPSDAVNIAVRCKVPVQVNKYLAHSDGMRVVESSKLASHVMGNDGVSPTEFDRPGGQPCNETEEFNLLRNMWKAATEERYTDAAQWRDRLKLFRARRNLPH